VDDNDAKVPIGYDGESGVIYTKKCLSVMTEYIWNAITKKKRKLILTFLGMVDAFNFAEQGFHVEDLLGEDLRNGASFETWHLEKRKYVLSPTSAKKPVYDEGYTIARLKEVFDRDDLLVGMEQNCALIDLAGPGRKAFQVTVSDDHDMKLKALEELLVVAGYIEKDKNGNFVAVPSDPASPHPKLDFYWVVPFGRFEAWKKKHPKTSRKASGVILDALDKYVIQHVLNMEVVSPSAQAIVDLVAAQPPWEGMKVVVEGEFGKHSVRTVQEMAM
jgi:hypothetical protein